ncbi:hypothetical protein B0H16DRAFT_1466537 [Mycena metata]|uniref:Uncharacterized protein n=1 Tax=Mycena metata TaxID=1033252 RepID=A0AAD7MX88_9AGAR|nr:hypothetical protein B0H16DRAFT_1466537 [Mycena metata]
MSPTSGEKAKATIQRRKERHRLKKHAIAQRKYRERHRAAIKESEEKTKTAREQRREVDAEYRERQRQKHWIKKFGQQSFEDVYVPLSRIHGRNTSRLQFVRRPVLPEEKTSQGRANNGYLIRD